MTKRKQHVYIVHREAHSNGSHHILGVFSDEQNALAHKNRQKYRDLNHGILAYIACTRHTVKGSEMILGNLVIL